MASEEVERSGEDRRFFPRGDAGRRDEDAQRTTFLPEAEHDGSKLRATPGTYLFLLFAMLVVGAVSVRSLNSALAPMLFDSRHISAVAAQMQGRTSYATYDLNIETRGLRHAHIRNLDYQPEIAVLGASHWQEAHAALMPGVAYYNAHVHRDYVEDNIAVVGWLVRYDRLPRKLVISVRDIQFMPPAMRTDHLWVPVLSEYRQSAGMFGVEPHDMYANGLTPQLRQVVSLPILRANIDRYFRAEEKPHAAQITQHRTLDVLLPDGAIYWSRKHRDSFTPERTYRESIALANAKRDNPPPVDPKLVEDFDRVLSFLRERGVEVFLAHPPFNPTVWDAVQGSPYLAGLRRIEELTAELAQRHGFEVIGSFDPYDVGCTTDMYIDGEHSSPECLGKILVEAL